MIKNEENILVEIIPVLKDNYIFLVVNQETREAVVVDPAVAPPVLDYINEHQLTLTHILNTHHHRDHVGGNLALKEATGAVIVGYINDAHRIDGAQMLVEDEQQIELLGLTIKVMAVPGHTLGHVVYYIPEKRWLFCGDTVFAMGCGYLFEGTYQQMYSSIQLIKTLPDETLIFCAHEYTLTNGLFALQEYSDNLQIKKRVDKIKKDRNVGKITIPTTIGAEKLTNPFFLARNCEEFTRLRQAKDVF